MFTDGDDHEAVWEYIRCYMQDGLDTLPECDNPDKANTLTGMQRLNFWVAPVVWPIDIDQESRTSGDFGSPFELLPALTSSSDVVFWALFVRYSVVVLPAAILFYVLYRLLIGYFY